MQQLRLIRMFVAFAAFAACLLLQPTDSAAEPEFERSESAAPPGNLTAPPPEETAKCKDNSKLYKGCDQVFKQACRDDGGDFLCDNNDCSEGTCHIYDDE